MKHQEQVRNHSCCLSAGYRHECRHQYVAKPNQCLHLPRPGQSGVGSDVSVVPAGDGFIRGFVSGAHF